MILTRRNLFGLIAAPAVIRVAQLMPISVPFVPRFGTSVFEGEEYIAAQRTLNFIQREMLRYARPLPILERIRNLDDELTAPLVDAMEKFHRNPIKFRRPKVFG